VAQHGNRRVVVQVLGDASRDPGFVPDTRATAVLAETFGGRPFNSPNDLAVHPATGDVFFTDPPYGLNGKEQDPAYEQSFNGIYRIDGTYAAARLAAARATAHGAATGTVTTTTATTAAVPLREPHLVSRDFTRPNGVAFSPDGRRMCVPCAKACACPCARVRV
jgi:sugar lactone lactonase YvrE